MDDEVGNRGFFKRGVEGLDQFVGQSAHEANGVGEQQRLFVGQGNFAGGGVERGEEFIFHQHICAGEAPQKRRFANVGVADDGGVGNGGAFAVLALGGAGAANFDKFLFEAVDLATGVVRWASALTGQPPL